MIRRTFAYLLLTLGCVVAIVPFLVTILASLKTKTELVQGVLSLPETAQWENYSRAWQQGNFDTYYLNSVIVAVGVVVPSIFLSAMSGYAFARFQFRGSKFLFAYLLIGLTIPLQAMVIPLFFLVNEARGWLDVIPGYNAFPRLDGLWPLILPQIGMSMSFGTLLMRQAYLSIPKEIAEASICDGASSWQTLWQIMFPLSRPIVGTLALLFFVWTWNEFLLPLVVNTDADFYTLPVGVLNFQQRWTSDIPVIAAGSTIIFTPLIVIFLIFQRQLVKAITAGAVKG